MRRTRAALALLAIASAAPAWATTWGSKTIVDPVDGKACTVTVPASMGSYIYEWPEKYDQVFFPVTSGEGIWACASGFASLIGDAELSATEKQRIVAYLAGLPRKERTVASVAQKLARAEALYELRELKPDKRSLMHRIFAYDFESLAADPAKAAFHRQQALKLMLQRLADEDLASGKRMEYLFVSANYLREQGDRVRSDRLLAQLWAEVEKNSEGEQADYAAYVSALIPGALRIAPGGRLAPEDPPRD